MSESHTPVQISTDAEIRERFEALWKEEYGHIPTWSENMRYLATPGAQQAFEYFKKGLLVRREAERRAIETLDAGIKEAEERGNIAQAAGNEEDEACWGGVHGALAFAKTLLAPAASTYGGAR